MKCEYCDNEVPQGSTRCPSCGAAVKAEAATPAAPAVQSSGQPFVAPVVNVVNMQPQLPPKSRTAYVLLGIFLGTLGIHNFYAGYSGRGIAQLLLSVLSCGYLSLISWIWAIVEICVTTRDGRGVQFN